jgi:hypothetical protein
MVTAFFTAGSRAWGRRVPPIAALVIAALIALEALPSALNLPQANPTQMLEYAPVPPDQNAPPPPGGSFSSLGLGSSSTLAQPLGAAPVASEPSQVPTDYQCVGNPPRQTEDPLSPPCVPYFTGNNGGATYQGVSAGEIRVVFPVDQSTAECVTSKGCEQTPPEGLYDLWKPPDPNEDVYARMLRMWQQYFNKRYQLYGRRAHFYVYYAQSGSGSTDTTDYTTPSYRAQLAASAYNAVPGHPFATIPILPDGNSFYYVKAMAQKGVMVFGGAGGGGLQTEQFYQQFNNLFWSYQPSVEVLAGMFTDYLCHKVRPGPVTYSPEFKGGQRKFGFLKTSDPDHPELQLLANLVQQQLANCGITFGSDVATFPSAGYVVDGRYPPSYAAQNMGTFAADGVTTIIWPGGFEVNQSKAASAEHYYPEWITLGDGYMDGSQDSAAQDPNEWNHAIVLSPNVPTNASEGANPNCVYAVKTTDPSMPAADYTTWACGDLYESLRQLFIGIQVAGPRLSPSAVNEGFRAIPAKESTDIYTPACYYPPGDFTCVKDAIEEWFDPSAPGWTWGTGNGVWKMMKGGRRHIRGGWTTGDFSLDISTATDPPNGFAGPAYFRGAT